MRNPLRIVPLAVVALSAAAPAGPAAAGGCDAAGTTRAACLARQADRMIARSEQRVATASRRMTGLPAHDLRAFEAWLRRSQAEWRERLEARCAETAALSPGDPAAGPACRVEAALRRDAEIDAFLGGRAARR